MQLNFKDNTFEKDSPDPSQMQPVYQKIPHYSNYTSLVASSHSIAT